MNQSNSMETLKTILSEQTVFKDLKPEFLDWLCNCAGEEAFEAGKFIFKGGESAENFYLIKSGKVVVQVYAPPKGALNIMTLENYDILGWSWLYSPYTYHFDAKAVTGTQAFVFDAVKVRNKCSENYEFGYHFMNCFSQIMLRRLVATRLQLLDIFGPDTASSKL